MKIIAQARAELAHLVRANVEAARKPGHFLCRLCNTISPKTTYFHQKGKSPIAHVSLDSRKLTVSSTDTQPTFIRPTSLQFSINQNKMTKARQWADKQIRTLVPNDQGIFPARRIGTIALKEVEKGNPERALAILELGINRSNDSNTFKQQVETCLADGNLKETHYADDLQDTLCALDLAFNYVETGSAYSQNQMLHSTGT